MPSNFYMYFVAALIPMVVGAVYYHPKVAGNSWMKVNGFTEESLKGGNMLVIFGVSYIFSIFLAFTVSGLVIHQSGIFSTFAPEVMEPGSAAMNEFNDIMSRYGDKFRTFGHGAVHGVFATIFFALPLIGINSLFERRGWKYILIHTGYWLITLILMGGLLCQTLQFAPLS
ncbi:MAG: DUF1761 domain-containing protein [Saprospiraceae bacterium]|nr:DUF1761 domain-containing protein [Saprospiraceae bacterium]